MTERFDAAYYRRFYGGPKTRVQGPREVARLAEGVVTMIGLAGGQLERALDVGAGTGLWRDWFKKNLPRITYRSTDVSAFACERYGHEQRDITKWRARERFDLIVCQGVLPYIDAKNATKAIENLAAMCRGFLYLEAITQEDLRVVCDLDATDVQIHRRPARWYRRRLTPSFVQLGLGLWMKRGAPNLLYALERGD